MPIPFEQEKTNNIKDIGGDPRLHILSRKWIAETSRYKYSYNFTWLGRPFIQFPQDILGIQEIIWQVKPDLIIETGIAHGGSLIFYSSMLELLGGSGKVLGVDIEIREHNRIEIEKHPMSRRITMIQGSSIDDNIVQQIHEAAKGKQHVMVVLDSNHTHDHVYKELERYSPLVTKGSYLIVCDTIIEEMPDEFFADRPWGKGNNPWTALTEFMKTNDRFVVDTEIENKLLITVAPSGYLKCIKD